jgi:hypothetical protein
MHTNFSPCFFCVFCCSFGERGIYMMALERKLFELHEADVHKQSSTQV